MNIKKFFTMILILSSSYIYAASDSIKVEKIIYKGLKRIHKNEILFKIPIKVKNITKSNINKIVNFLFSTGYFENIKVFLDKNDLIFEFKEKPVIDSINVTGEKNIKNNIINIINKQGIKIGDFLNKNLLFYLKKNIEEFYYNEGKFDSYVKFNIDHITKNRVRLNIKAYEGDSFNIKKINILGNKVFSYKELISILDLKSKTPWWKFINDKKYSKGILMKNIKNIYNFYYKKGFANFNINSIRVNLNRYKKNIYITLYIKEGIKYKISDIKIERNKNEEFCKIKKIIDTIKIGNLYNGVKILKTKDKIKNILVKKGYINPKIKIVSDIDDKHKSIILKYKIFFGERYYVRYINFSGNHVNKDIVLRREIPQMEQNIINIDLLKKGKENLDSLNYFNKVEFEIIPVSNKKNQVDILYKVKEINTGNINIGLGYSSKNGINFQFNINQYNWLGTGNSFLLNATKNSSENIAEINIVNPYITHKGIGLYNKIFYNNINSDNENMLDYDIHNNGSETMLSFPLKENCFINLGINYSHQKINNIKPQISICRYLDIFKIKTDIKEKNIKVKSNDFLFHIKYIMNKLNDFYFPTYGKYLRISSMITLPYSYNKYYKIFSSYKHFIPLTNKKNWILIGKIRLGYLQGIKNKEPPFFSNFFSNNKNIIRGFSDNTIGPKAIYYKYDENNKKYDRNNIIVSNNSIGGNAIGVANLELVIPMFFLNETNSKYIRTLAFLDIGTILDTNWKNTKLTKKFNILNYKDFKKIRMSYGVSFQWVSPIGPLSCSYAQPIKKYSQDKIEKFQFNIGKTW